MALRLIAFFKVLKGLVLIAAGVTALRLVDADVAAVIAEWADRLNVDPQNHYIAALLSRLSSLDQRTLRSIGAGSFVYAALTLTEGIGLWLQRRWAEYFTILVTSSFIPLEVHETWKRFTVMRLAVIVVNVMIVAYLVKRVRRERR